MTDTTNEEVAAAPPKKSGSAVLTLAAVAVLSLIAAGGGWYLGGILGPQKTAEGKVAAMQSRHGQTHEKGAATNGEELATAANGVALLQPITTNLAYPSDTWIRLEVALQFRGKPDLAVAESIHQDMMAYLRTLSLQQIEGARGFEHLHSDLEQRAILRSQGRVTRLMFRTFVVE